MLYCLLVCGDLHPCVPGSTAVQYCALPLAFDSTMQQSVHCVVCHQDDAADAQWFPLSSLPQPLAFDHKEVVRTALAKLAEQPAAADTGVIPNLDSVPS